ncbi:hypothetical protein niasHS_003989 [Heterodera schachtii]|uniref:Uncharacterized protein n=1 Tax=Heterodera schachtii TaxID=97005 RepID=A0ABD2K3S4_HETSC
MANTFCPHKIYLFVLFLLRLFLLGTEAVVSTQMKLIQDLLENYDRKAKPTWDNVRPVNVTFSMDLYQILELNEPQQYLLLNSWIIERWHDEFLYWNPLDYANISELRLPYDCIWLPDTTLYNSLVMKDDDSRRLLNAKLTTNMTRKFSCLLNLRYFPYDLQECTMTFSSWTYDNKGIDYVPYSDEIGTSNYLENEGWYLLSSTMRREEVKYTCCPNKYTLLKLTLYLRRKPLFYLINLIIPTAIITLIAIVGFFTTSSASGMREEKVSLGITTLLSMSILMLMVSDQMPTTSTFIPLIGWFILGMIGVISLGTLASSVVIAVQKRGRLGERLTKRAVRIAKIFGAISYTEVPLHLRKGTREHAEAPPPSASYRRAAKLATRLANRRTEDDDGTATTTAPKKPQRTFSQLLRRATVPSAAAAATTANGGGESVGKMPTDKSTEPLIETGGEDAEKAYDQAKRHSFVRRCGSAVPIDAMADPTSVASARSSAMPSPRAPPLHSAVKTQPLHSNAAVLMPFSLSLISADDESEEASQASGFVSPSGRTAPGGLRHGVGMFNENLRLSRQLAVKEFEWLATIVERCCFIVFATMFFFLSIGINLLGYWHWANPELAFNNYTFVDQI